MILSHMRSETVLVTGAMGFVGSHTVNELVNQGFDVVATDISMDTRRLEKIGVMDKIEIRQLDLADLARIMRIVQENDVDYIIHLGAATSLIAKEHPRTAINANVIGTYNILEMGRILDAALQRIVWASSMSVYGKGSYQNQSPVTEDDPINPNSVYAGTKACCEQLAVRYRNGFDVSAVGLRPTGVYGPFNNPDYLLSEEGDVSRYRSPSGRLAGIFAKAGQELPVSMSVEDTKTDWIYVTDVAKLFVAAMTAPEQNLSRAVYNAASGQSATFQEMTCIIQEYLPNVSIDIEMTDESSYIPAVDGSTAYEDFDYKPTVSHREGVKRYLNAIRRDQDIEPLIGSN